MKKKTTVNKINNRKVKHDYKLIDITGSENVPEIGSIYNGLTVVDNNVRHYGKVYIKIK